MPNDFTDPSILASAGAHASSLVAEAGGAWGNAFAQLGQWAESRKTLDAQTAAREREQQVGIQAEKDAAAERNAQENARFLVSLGYENGYITFTQAANLLKVQIAGNAAQAQREGIAQGVVATGIFNTEVPGMGRLGNLVSQVNELRGSAERAYAMGDYVTGQAKAKTAQDIIDNPEVQARLSMAGRSKLPFEVNMSQHVLGDKPAERLAEAMRAGYGKTEAALLSENASPEVARLKHRQLIGEDLAAEERDMANFVEQVAAPKEKGGRADWNRASQLYAAVDGTFKRLGPDILGNAWADKTPAAEGDRLSLLDTVKTLALTGRAFADAGGISVDKLLGTVSDAVKSMVPDKTDTAGRRAALTAVSDMIKSVPPELAGSVAGFLGAVKFSKYSPAILQQRGRDAVVAYARTGKFVSELDALKGLPGMGSVPSKVLMDAPGAAANQALGDLSDDSTVRTWVDRAETAQLRKGQLAITASGRPNEAVGEFEPPNAAKRIAASVALPFVNGWVAAADTKDPKASRELLMNKAVETLVAKAKAVGQDLPPEEAKNVLLHMLDLPGTEIAVVKGSPGPSPSAIEEMPDQPPPEEFDRLSLTRTPVEMLEIKSNRQAAVAAIGSFKAGKITEEGKPFDPGALTPEQQKTYDSVYAGNPAKYQRRLAELRAQKKQLIEESVQNLRWNASAGRGGDDALTSAGLRAFMDEQTEAVLVRSLAGADENMQRKILSDTLDTVLRPENFSNFTFGKIHSEARVPLLAAQRLAVLGTFDDPTGQAKWDEGHLKFDAAKQAQDRRSVIAAAAKKSENVSDFTKAALAPSPTIYNAPVERMIDAYTRAASQATSVEDLELITKKLHTQLETAKYVNAEAHARIKDAFERERTRLAQYKAETARRMATLGMKPEAKPDANAESGATEDTSHQP